MQFAATHTTTWHGCRNMMDRRHQASRCRTALSSRSAATRHQAFDAPAATDGLRERGADLTRFLMEHKVGVDEITTKIAILQEEFAHLHDYNPIDHLESRDKSSQSIRKRPASSSCSGARPT